MNNITWHPLPQFNNIYSISSKGMVRRNEGFKESFYMKRKQPSYILKQYESKKGKYVLIRFDGDSQKKFFISDLLNSV